MKHGTEPSKTAPGGRLKVVAMDGRGNVVPAPSTSSVVRHAATCKMATSFQATRFALALLLLLGPDAGTAIRVTSLAHGQESENVQESRSFSLPFDRPSPQPDAQPRSIEQFWKLAGITEQDWAKFDDQEGVSDAERPVLLRIVERLSQLEPDELAAMALDEPDAAIAWQAPAQHRGQMVSAAGRARRCKPVELTEQEKSHYATTGLFRIEVDIQDFGFLILYAAHVPEAWQQAEELNEPMRAWAVLTEGGGGTQLWASAVTPRVAWYPVEARPELGVLPSHVRLARQGFDIAWLDHLRKSNGQPLAAADRAPFYTLLAVVQKEDVTELEATAFQKLDLPQLLFHAQQYQGQLFSFTASVRRATKVEVDDQAVKERFGLSAYYELDILIPLGDVSIQLPGPDPQKRPVYENNYPATVCTVRVPEAIEQAARRAAAGKSESPLINETVRVKGYFFKIWAYPSEYVASRAPGQLHPSPLFVATTVEVVASPSPPRDHWLSATVAVIFVVGMLAIVYLAWKWK
ncbi:MAG: hypothetical protein KatS3mg110_1152 [Pirellulaceae bacterium]|nr:MAG: hypothetical protein KatS3mg110_1152 [Pirellulaceae bacterium]